MSDIDTVKNHESISLNVEIGPASPDDALAVARFCQPIYAAVYPNDKYGLTAQQFSPEVFETENTLDYFRQILENNDQQRAYIARLGNQIVGTISVTEFADHYEPRCFYVDLGQHGQGVGRVLWEKAMEFCEKPLPVRVEVAETNAKTIAMYEQWGFKEDESLGVNMRHWPEWPENVQNGYIFLKKYPEAYES